MMDRAPKKILIIKPSALGDIILALPALSALRNSFPQAKISTHRKQMRIRENHPLPSSLLPIAMRSFIVRSSSIKPPVMPCTMPRKYIRSENANAVSAEIAKVPSSATRVISRTPRPPENAKGSWDASKTIVAIHVMVR